MKIQAGDLWLVQFTPQIGSEQAGIRPALVVSSDRFNQETTRIKVVMPLTSRDRGWPTHVGIDPRPENGLTKRSWILCEQVRATAEQRFKKRLGAVEIEELDQALHVLNRWVLAPLVR